MIRMGRYKFIAAALFLALAALCSAAAAAISFQVVQHDVSQSAVRSSSYVMEAVFFDCFFDAGHIATNIPTVSSASEEDDEDFIFSALEDTKSGFCDYLVMIVVDYNSTASSNPEAVLLSNIQKVAWFVYDAASENLLMDGGRTVGTVPDKANNAVGVRDLAKKLAADINAAVRKR